MHRLAWFIAGALLASVARAAPVTVAPVPAAHGMVVAGHPQAAMIGRAVLKNGGNAIDAAVATSLALGVAEPYGSGLGGKLMLLYFEAKSGRVYALDAMDACGSRIDPEAYQSLPNEVRSYGYTAVCVPGLVAGLWAAHQKWGAHSWAADVTPAVALARDGVELLPKAREFFLEQEKKLRRGDGEIARFYLPAGRLPDTGMSLKNADLSATLELLAKRGRDGFYRGPVAESIVKAAQSGGGALTLDDFARYEVRVVEPIGIDFHGSFQHSGIRSLEFT